MNLIELNHYFTRLGFNEPSVCITAFKSSNPKRGYTRPIARLYGQARVMKGEFSTNVKDNTDS